MPIYEYECSTCGHFLEKLQKVSDPPLTRCPVCHGETLKKLVSAAGFRLKGGGWYETDFKTGNKKNVSASREGNKTTSANDGSKPAAKDKKSSSE